MHTYQKIKQNGINNKKKKLTTKTFVLGQPINKRWKLILKPFDQPYSILELFTQPIPENLIKQQRLI